MNKNLIDFISRMKKAFYSSLKVVSILYLIFGSLAGVIGAVMSMLIVIEFISSFLETALGFLNNFFLMGSLGSSDSDGNTDKDLIKSKGIGEFKVREVSNISFELTKLHLSDDLLLKVKEKYSRLNRRPTQDMLIRRLNSTENVLKDKDVLDIIICYIEHFGKFNFKRGGFFESISIFVSASHKDFLYYACRVENIGRWCGSDLLLRRGDIDDLFYELRIDAFSGLGRVVSRLERDGFIGYKFTGRTLDLCERKNWIMDTNNICNLSESRLYGLLIVTFDVEQYKLDFGIKFQLVSDPIVQETNSAIVKGTKSANVLDRRIEAYKALINYIGISCVWYQSSIKIKGGPGMRLFLAKWGFSLMGGSHSICKILCNYYRISVMSKTKFMDNNKLLRIGRIGSVHKSAWGATVLRIEEIRFERYRVPRERRMEIIEKILFDDFLWMSFDFKSRTLSSLYSIWTFGLGIKFQRDWRGLDKDDADKYYAGGKAMWLEAHIRFLEQKKETLEERRNRQRIFEVYCASHNYSEAWKFKDGDKYPGKVSYLRKSVYYLSKYKVGELSPSSNRKVGSFRHERLTNYYVGMRDFWNDDSKRNLD